MYFNFFAKKIHGANDKVVLWAKYFKWVACSGVYFQYGYLFYLQIHELNWFVWQPTNVWTVMTLSWLWISVPLHWPKIPSHHPLIAAGFFWIYSISVFLISYSSFSTSKFRQPPFHQFTFGRFLYLAVADSLRDSQRLLWGLYVIGGALNTITEVLETEQVSIGIGILMNKGGETDEHALKHKFRIEQHYKFRREKKQFMWKLLYWKVSSVFLMQCIFSQIIAGKSNHVIMAYPSFDLFIASLYYICKVWERSSLTIPYIKGLRKCIHAFAGFTLIMMIAYYIELLINDLSFMK